MTEVGSSDIAINQNSQLTEDFSSLIRPAQRAQTMEFSSSDMTESSCSDMGTDQETQITEDSFATTDDLKGQLIYRCKKCRRIVASQDNIVSHEQGKGREQGFGRRRSVEPIQPECVAIFVEPLKWMETVQEGYVLQKLHCKGCKTRLGSFNWAGMQCSCGVWVNPAFQINKSRVDECRI